MNMLQELSKKISEFDKEISRLENLRDKTKLQLQDITNSNNNIGDVNYSSLDKFIKDQLCIYLNDNYQFVIVIYSKKDFYFVNNKIKQIFDENKLNYSLDDDSSYCQYSINIDEKNKLKKIIDCLKLDYESLKDIIDNFKMPNYKKLQEQCEYIVEDLNIEFK